MAGARTQYGYDPISRLSALSHDLDGASAANDASFGFGYNPASQIVTREPPRVSRRGVAVGGAAERPLRQS